MGTKCAPPYANIFMGAFEERHIYPRILHKTRLYLRYIDDIMFIWKGTEKELKKFLDEINLQHPTIKFDHKSSRSEIEFLDLKIYKDAQGKLATKLYSKPTDRQAYLHKSSAHPHHLKKSIPYGQALRMRRICTDLEEFEKAGEKLSTKLKERGYTDTEITAQINRARTKPREDLLKYTSKEQDTPRRIPYVVTYSPNLPDKHYRQALAHPQHQPEDEEDVPEQTHHGIQEKSKPGRYPGTEDLGEQQSRQKGPTTSDRRLHSLFIQGRQQVLQTYPPHHEVQKQPDKQILRHIPQSQLQEQMGNISDGMHHLQGPVCWEKRVADEHTHKQAQERRPKIRQP